MSADKTETTAIPWSYRLKSNLRNCNLDAYVRAVMRGLTQNYITPFALALGATAFQIGLLSGLPMLVVVTSQFFGPRMAEKAGDRKRFVLWTILLDALSWVPIILAPFIGLSYPLLWFIGFVLLSTAFSALNGPAWSSMASDIVPPHIRGRYFGRQGVIAGLTLLAASLIASFFLSHFGSHSVKGFAIIFGLAVVARLLSWYFISKIQDRPRNTGQRVVSIVDMIRTLGTSNLGRFVLTNGLIDFVVSISSPFFAVYLLRDLSFNIVTYNIVTQIARVSTLMFMAYWGKRADRSGNMKVFKVTYVLLAIVPFAWVATSALPWLIVVQVVSGFAWAGFNLVSINFIYDAAQPENISRHIALLTAVCGIGSFLGSLAGGLLVPIAPMIRGTSLLSLFLLTGFLHIVIMSTMMRGLKEVRVVPTTSLRNSMFGLFPFRNRFLSATARTVNRLTIALWTMVKRR